MPKLAAEALGTFALVFTGTGAIIIDRFRRRAVLIGADLFRAALVLTLVWPQGAWHAYLVAAGITAGNTFFNPTVQAVIPALTTDDQRLAANSVASSTGQLVQIIASALAGGLGLVVLVVLGDYDFRREPATGRKDRHAGADE